MKSISEMEGFGYSDALKKLRMENHLGDFDIGRVIAEHKERYIVKTENGMVDFSEGLENTFDRILKLSQNCKFSDCTHTNEVGCAIKEAVGKGEIDQSAYWNFLKIEREKEHFELSVSERRKKEKTFGKMVKNLKNDMRKINPKHRK